MGFCSLVTSCQNLATQRYFHCISAVYIYGVYLRGACPQLSHVVTDGLGCRHGTGQLPGLDDCCTSLLHCLQKKTGAIRAGMCYCVLMLIWKKGKNIFTAQALWKSNVCAQILHAYQSLNSNSRTLFYNSQQ